MTGFLKDVCYVSNKAWEWECKCDCVNTKDILVHSKENIIITREDIENQSVEYNDNLTIEGFNKIYNAGYTIYK